MNLRRLRTIQRMEYPHLSRMCRHLWLPALLLRPHCPATTPTLHPQQYASTVKLLPPHYGEEIQKEMRFVMHVVFFIACMVLCVLCHSRQMSSRSAIGAVQVRAIHSRVVVVAILLAAAVLVRPKKILVPCLILRTFFIVYHKCSCIVSTSYGRYH